MAYNNRNFMVFNVSELEKIDFSNVLETSVDTVRKSLDNKTFVKWDGETPQCVLDLTTKEGPFTHEEILLILEGNNWNDINQSLINID
jgi:hypothetical protein